MNSHQSDTDHDRTIDALGTLCPEPMLRARQALAAMQAGETLAVLADDPLAEVDLTVMCERLGHELVSVEARAVGQCFFVRKG